MCLQPFPSFTNSATYKGHSSAVCWQCLHRWKPNFHPKMVRSHPILRSCIWLQDVAHCKGAVPVQSQRAIQPHRCYDHITRSGYLHDSICSEEFVKEFVARKIQEWSEQLVELSNIATTQPHATFTAFGLGNEHSSLVKSLGRTLQDSDKNLAKIIARFVARMSNNYARSLQNSSKIFAKILQELSKNLAEFFQDPCKILQELSKILARIIQDSFKNHPRNLQDSSKIHAKLQELSMNLSRFLQESCKILG